MLGAEGHVAQGLTPIQVAAIGLGTRGVTMFRLNGHTVQGLAPSAEALGDKCKEGGAKG